MLAVEWKPGAPPPAHWPRARKRKAAATAGGGTLADDGATGGAASGGGVKPVPSDHPYLSSDAGLIRRLSPIDELPASYQRDIARHGDFLVLAPGEQLVVDHGEANFAHYLLAGTVGMQTSAVLVRGFAVGQIVDGKRLRVFLTEVQVGLSLGAMCALLALPAATWFVSKEVGFSMALALLIAMTWTTTIASAIAMGTEAAGKDPAVVAGPLMIAVSDLSAVVIFFLTAEALLGA